MRKKGYLYLTLILSFLLGTRNGFIALWTGDNADPEIIFPYRVESLPESDQQALEHGITVTDRAALNQLLEDYLS